jgi:hypothetical protein
MITEYFQEHELNNVYIIIHTELAALVIIKIKK